MRRPGGTLVSSINGRTGGVITLGAPTSAPSTASNSAAVSRTLRLTQSSMARPLSGSPETGPAGTRPRVGFKPTRPQAAAGIRIEPPPSLACAMGRMRAATADAAPPLEPPALRVTSHGLRVGPCRSDSQVGLKPNSGVGVVPMVTSPARRKRRINSLSAWDIKPSQSLLPMRKVEPAACTPISLIRKGTPVNGPSGRPSSRARSACSERSLITQLSSGLSASMAPSASSFSSRGVISRRRTSSAKPSAS